jgi:hypothetical protein
VRGQVEGEVEADNKNMFCLHWDQPFWSASFWLGAGRTME